MPKIYVRMPMAEEFKPMIEKVQSTCAKLGFEILPRTNDWKTCLQNSAFAIIDMSIESDFPNVAFEMGYAIRAGKNSLLIARQGVNIPNLGQKNTLIYDIQDLEKFSSQFVNVLINFCQSQRIRYQRYPNMPAPSTEETIPLLEATDMRIENFVALGDSFVDSQQLEDALNEYSRAILYLGRKGTQNPEDAYIFFKRAYVAKRLGNVDNALDDYKISIELKPDYLDAYVARGMLLYEKQKYELALQDFQKASQIKPDFTRVYVLAGMMQRHNGNYDAAMKEFHRAIELNPEFSEAFYQRGILYTDLKDLDKALEDFSQAIVLNNKYVEAYIKRGVLYLSLQKYDLALVDFNKAIELAPEAVEAYHLRGQTLFEKGYKEFHELAIKDWQKAISLGHPNADILEEKIRITSKTLA